MPDASILQWAALTHSGSRKPRNDDALIAFASSPGGAEMLGDSGCRSLDCHDLVFAVSDGMGGGNAGDLASSLLLQRMTEIIPETFKIAASGFFPDCLDHLADAIRSVHEHINQAAACDHTRGMAATLALAWFTPDNLYLANAGDSRIYLSRNGQLTQLTRDHTAAWGQWKRGEISEIEYRSHPRRSALYEVIGGGHNLVCPHFAAVPFQTNDRFHICTDGLIDGVWERHISNAMASSSDPAATTRNLYLANAGDSRIYLSRNGQLTQLTRDHTAAWGQWKRGEISEIEYRSHPRRSALYEVIGGGHNLVCPHFAAVPFQTNDRFLICTDGLIDGVWERHISNALASSRDPAATTRTLLQRAIDNSGIDDISLIVIHANEPPVPEN